MPDAEHAASAVTATAFANMFHPSPPRAIIAAEPGWACSAPEQPVSDSERRSHETQTELARANRAAILGQVSASIAEIIQPISAVVMNAEAALRLLLAQPTDTEAVRRLLACIIKDGMRTGDIVNRTRALTRKECVEINAVTLEAINVTHDELVSSGVSVQTELAKDLPLIEGDRVQLQQVMVNLIVNAIEAMRGAGERTRELLVSTGKAEPNGIRVGVRDSGPGLAPADLERVFEAFYTTKSGGLGMGLSICRSIIEAHGGRLWATGHTPRGAFFQFTIPAPPA
jgi:C4-dicarboxylate-specific signal transduction histidine kinase